VPVGAAAADQLQADWQAVWAGKPNQPRQLLAVPVHPLGQFRSQNLLILKWMPDALDFLVLLMPFADDEDDVRSPGLPWGGAHPPDPPPPPQK
jgi:hypothetical protein